MTRTSRLLVALVVVSTAACAPGAPPRVGDAVIAELRSYSEKVPGTPVTLEMMPVAAGTVQLGNSTTALAAFWIAKTEITWDLYDEFVFGTEELPAVPRGIDAISRPSKPYMRPGDEFGHHGYPAVGVSFRAAKEFARWVSAKTGNTYRLPTEAEWMRACVAGQVQSPTSHVPSPPSQLPGPPTSTTHPAGTLPPDALGVHDMLGNVAEWIVAGADSMVAGGFYATPAAELRCSARLRQTPAWSMRDPQLPKSRWWLTDAPFVGIRLVSGAGG